MSGAPEKVEGIMTVKRYVPRLVRVGELLLKVYEALPELEKIEKVEARGEGDVVEPLLRRITRALKEVSSPAEELLVEVDAEGRGFALHVGRSSERPKPGETVLFPRPARLVRVGLPKGETIKWLRPDKREYHVFEGFVEAPSWVDVVLIETDKGLRAVKPLRAERPGDGG
ncbi:MAG: hypothetical protein QXU52_02010 [Fervidicoccaceae archaeon]